MWEEVSISLWGAGAVFTSWAMESPDDNHVGARRATGSLGPLLLFSDPPERTHSEPGKGHGKTNSDGHAASSDLSGLIFAEFFDAGAGEAERHHEEDNSHDLQPQLMQNIPK